MSQISTKYITFLLSVGLDDSGDYQWAERLWYYLASAWLVVPAEILTVQCTDLIRDKITTFSSAILIKTSPTLPPDLNTEYLTTENNEIHLEFLLPFDIMFLFCLRPAGPVCTLQQQIFSFNGYWSNVYNIKYNGERERGRGKRVKWRLKNIKVQI